MQRGLIIIPYADKLGFNVGVNISKINLARDIYLKNCSVAAISARKKCSVNTDIAIVTNIDLPEPYKGLLERESVLILNCPFDKYNFGSQYNWSLAFYKICALDYVVRNFKYDYYSYIDTDVYVQDSFDHIWEECNYNILMYDINHGLSNKHYCHFLNEILAFDSTIVGGLTQYGGEFYASNASNAKAFLSECYKIYTKMIQCGLQTTHGDEFITSLAAYYLKPIVKNAGSYVYRYWTGMFHLISTNYEFNPVVVLHCPSEKEDGMLILYKKYILKGKMPSSRTLYKLLHLSSPSIKRRIRFICSKILYLFNAKY